MATTKALAQTQSVSDSGAVTDEKVTYRGYVKLDENGAIKSFVAKSESANKANWLKLEADGNILWNQNDFIKYIVHSDAGFKLLVPDEEQRLYIIQSGLNYIQNSKANGLMSERKEGDENSPAFNDQTIELKEYINEPPTKRALTDRQKLERLVKSMGLSPAEVALMLKDIGATFAAQASPTEQEETEVSA